MRKTATGFLADGARLLAQRKAMLAWIYAGFLLLGLAAHFAFANAIGSLLNHSLYADRLAHGFDLAALMELTNHPTVQLGPPALASGSAIVLFALLLLFCTSGVAAEFLAPAPLGNERFFQTCGAFWWRMVRLVLLTLLILLPTLGVLGGIRTALMHAADRSAHLRLPFMIFVTVSVFMQLVLLGLRAWFDTAEFHLIRSNESAARRAIGAARRMTRGYRWQLLWMYLLPCLGMWALTAVWLLLWYAAPSARVGVAFVLGQLIVITWIVGRLWQRATQAAWFTAHEIAVEALPVSAMPATPAEQIDAAPPAPEPEPEIDLP